MLQLDDLFLRRPFAEHRLRRVPRHEVDEGEHERRDPQQYREREQQSAKQISNHECSPENILETHLRPGLVRSAGG